ncbi:MptD family putative ECF transporter S component [Paenibacillus sp. ACRRX]|uniref:MptD family putative ECF transporter S component n=1 Tax=unclassified Paenibacillus TaxID=185978 RepID=UPI001EF42E6F|nr:MULTISPECIES: MptD family putative ECF transporter S component [unclassified Paenibacillus]MCG7409842.1 MptD family putative ECF transporter S component [Paenibacillus sp. ACRRX]MDK8183090.1 MptD family putative ECF transporter S component [Paenibacillus sp. UMB4589-SE434]
MQTETVVLRNSWKMRDFITLAIFNVVMILIFTIGFMFTSILLTPAGSYIAGTGLIALVNGPIYMVMSNKIDRRGILFFTSLITGVYFIAFGYAYFLLTLAIVGVLGELAMWGTHTYRNPVRNAIGYSIYNVGFSFCGVMPILFFKEQYEATLSQSMSPEQVAQNLYYYGTPSMVILMSAFSLVGAVVGCALGNRLLHKHVKKAKLV